VSRFGYGGRVLFITEDEASHAYLKQRWAPQTVLVQLRDLGLERYPEENASANPSSNSTYGSKHSTLPLPHTHHPAFDCHHSHCW